MTVTHGYVAGHPPAGYHYEAGRCPSAGMPCNCIGACRVRLVADEPPTLLDAIRDAEAEKAAAFDHLDTSDSHDENTLLREQIVALGRRLDVFSANDLPEWVRERTNPNRRGRMFSQLAREDVLAEVGMVKSSNVKAHGKRVLTYRLVAA